jgi:hypothetical protein
VGPGVATGGTANQVLKKVDGTDYNTTWGTIAGAVYQASAPSSPQTGDVWVDSDAVAGVLNQNDYLLKADASASTGYVSKVGGDTVIASGAAVKPLVLKGASAQTANLQEWQDSTGAVVASVSPTGNIVGGGLVLLNSTTITAQSTVNIDNIFTSSFRNYRVVIALTTVATTGGPAIQLRAGGSTNASNNYTHAGVGYVSNIQNTSQYSNGLSSSWQLGYVVNSLGGLSSTEITIYNPQQTQYSTYTGITMSTVSTTNNYMFAIGGMMNVTTAYDGLSLVGPGNMTGVIRIYGLRD